jgi:hypothetical protein
VVGDIAGSIAGNHLAGRAGQWVGKKMSAMPRAQKLGNNLSYGINNAGPLLKEHLDNGPSWGIADGLKDFLRDAMPSTAPNTKLDVDGIQAMNQPAVFTNMVRKSIVEIIPGYLSHIHREIKAMRTGDDNAEMLSFDHNSGKFKSSKALAEDFLKKNADKGSVERVNRSFDDLLKFMGAEKMSDEDKKDLKKQLLQRTLAGKANSAKNLSDTQQWQGDKRGKFAGMFGEFTDKDKHGGAAVAHRQRLVAEHINDMAAGLTDNRANIQDHVNAGQLAIMQQAGIVDEHGNINLETLAAQHAGEHVSAAHHKSMQSTGPRKVKVVGKKSAFDRASYHSSNTVHAPTTNNVHSDLDAGPIVDALGRIDPIKHLDENGKTLLRIEELIKKLPYAATGHSTDGSASPGPKKHWYNQSIGDLAGGMFSAGKHALGSAFGMAKAGIQHGFNFGTSAMGKAASFATGLAGATYDKITGKIHDIYVDGELLPRLSGIKLKAGHYRDQATGKVIKAFKDIKGTIIDENGDIVLDVSEMKRAFMKGKKMSRLIDFLSGSIKGAVSIGKDLFNGAVSLQGAVFRAGLAGVKAAVGLLRRPYDVYVKGELKPRLLAVIMKSGGYISQLTKKLIRHPRDIDGPVVDQDGNIVVSAEDMATGLVDAAGHPAGSAMRRILSRLGAVAGKVFGVAKSIGKAALGVAGDVWDKTKGVFSKVLDINVGILGSNKKTVSVLEQILALLDARLPKPKKHVVGDMDGDGIRDGSAADLDAKAKKASEEDAEPKGKKKKDKDDPEGKKGLLAKFAGMFGKKKKDDEEDGVGGGIKAKLMDWGLKALGFGSVGAIGGATVAGAGTAAAGATAAGAGTAVIAGTGLAAAEGAAVVGAGAGALGTAATVGGVILTGVGAVLASPVLLTALGIAAVGAIGYGVYHYATARKMTDLFAVRYAQYGFIKDDDTHLSKIFELEDLLKDATVFQGEVASIDPKKVEMKKLLSAFGIANDNGPRTKMFATWLDKRFKPIFLAHASAIKAIDPSLDATESEKLMKKPKDALAYLNATAMPNGPYDNTTSPFDDLKYLMATGDTVASMVRIARDTIQKLMTDKPDDKVGETSAIDKSKVAGAAAMAAAATSKAQASAKAEGDDQSSIPKPPPAANAAAGNGNAGTVSASASMAPADFIYTGGNRLDALTSIRYKCYGLVDMDREKVNALVKLEEYLTPQLTFNGAKKAAWNGNPDKVLDACKAHFGVPEARGSEGYAWSSWFTQRFMPVFLNFMTAMNAATGKTKIADATTSLRPSDAEGVAKAMFTTSVGGLIGKSIWTVGASPWPGYVLNSDKSSIDGNIAALKEVVKATTLDEKTGRSDAQKAQAGASGFLATENAGGAAFVMRKQVSKANDPNAGVKAVGDAIGGMSIQHPGAGSGGDINAVKEPGSGTGWAAMKGTVTSAAEQVGVDPKALAVMTAMESNFDPKAAAGTSSAKGLMQFTGGTWDESMTKYAKKFGIAAGTQPTDARASMLLGAQLMKDNTAYLQKYLNRPLTTTDLYLAHFLGAAGAVKLLSADPKSIAADLLPAAAKANQTIFFDKNNTPRTCGEIIQLFTDRLASRMKQSGMSESDFPGGSKGAIGGPDLKGEGALSAGKGGIQATLQREASTDSGTFGILMLPDGTAFQTLELAWKDNERQKSCIPTGTYQVALVNSPKFGPIYEVKGVQGRTSILIHSGNTAGNVEAGQKSDVNGCILLGKTRGNVGGQPAVLGSKNALQEFMQKLAGQSFTLSIKGGSAGVADAPNADGKVVKKPDGTTPAGAIARAASGSPAASATAAAPSGQMSPAIPAGAPVGSRSAAPTTMPGGSPTANTASPVRVAASAGGGFTPTAMASGPETAAQNATRQANGQVDMSEMQKVLRDSLGVQVGMRDILQKILDNGNSMGQNRQAITGDKSTVVAGAMPAKAMPDAPVSMAKMTA